MRSLNRNKQLIWYALYEGKTRTYDEYGHDTGEPRLLYSEPTPFMANVSAARGSSDLEQFGINSNYTKTITTNDIECPIDEHAHLWVGISPIDNVPFNYVVTRVARSLNSITYAIKEVDVQ